MQPDSRIEDVLHTLLDPEEYVRGILVNCSGFDEDKAVIRIGISGSGKAPHYCIEQGPMLKFILPVIQYSELSEFERREIFNGRGHSSILEDQFMGKSWSSAAMTIPEVQALLGRLRANKKVH